MIYKAEYKLDDQEVVRLFERNSWSSAVCAAVKTSEAIGLPLKAVTRLKTADMSEAISNEGELVNG